MTEQYRPIQSKTQAGRFAKASRRGAFAHLQETVDAALPKTSCGITAGLSQVGTGQPASNEYCAGIIVGLIVASVSHFFMSISTPA